MQPEPTAERGTAIFVMFNYTPLAQVFRIDAALQRLQFYRHKHIGGLYASNFSLPHGNNVAGVAVQLLLNAVRRLIIAAYVGRITTYIAHYRFPRLCIGYVATVYTPHYSPQTLQCNVSTAPNKYFPEQ